MGVYIKDMKMPKDHLYCPFRGPITEMCIVIEKWCNEFNDGCPLVEVKASHGRLGDLDALKAEIIRTYEYEFPTATGAFDEFMTRILPNIINNAHTIIEAEGEYDA